MALIQVLIPLGLEAVKEILQHQVRDLASGRYARKAGDQVVRRWGRQKGWVYLADQKLPVEVPRVRDVAADVGVPLAAYKALQAPRKLDEGLLLRVQASPVAITKPVS